MFRQRDRTGPLFAPACKEPAIAIATLRHIINGRYRLISSLSLSKYFYVRYTI